MARNTSVMLFVLMTLAARGWTLDSSRALTQFNHDVWQIENGLPQNTVATIVQTKDGYLWMGTHEGLVRFDGVHFTVFDKRNTEAILSNDVYALFEARDGTLWFGTYGGGVHNYKNGKFNNFLGKSSEIEEVVTSFAEDSNGGLWIGMNAGGLLHYSDGRFRSYSSKIAIQGDIIRDLAMDHEGAVWIATSSNGLLRIHNDEVTRYDITNGMASNTVWAVLEDHAHNVWIGTEGGPGLSRLRNGKLEHFIVEKIPSGSHVWALYEDSSHALWIGTRGSGLLRYAGGEFSQFSRPEGLSDTSVRTILEDREGSLWIGTDGGGLNRLKQGKFQTYTVQEGLSDNSTWSVFEARNGSIWIGTRNGGVNQYRDGKFRAFTVADGLSHNTVRSVIEDRNGVVWIGTRGGGLNRFENGQFTKYTIQDGLGSDTVWSVFEDRDGSLWIGTDNGLNHYKDGKFSIFRTEQGLSNNIVMCTVQDRQGNLWVGTDAGGVNVLRNGQITETYSIREGLAANSIISIYEDRNGTMWIGTWGGGLSRLQNKKITTYSMKNGLFDDVVFQTLEDSKGNMWMSSNKGIFRVRKQELEDMAAGKIRRIQSHGYGTADGMKSNECNGANYPAGWKTKDGKLWIPTVHGVTVIDPDNLPMNTVPPTVVVEKIITDRGKVDTATPLGGDVSLDNEVEKIEFQYTALSYLAPEKVLFRFMLEGFDRGWSDAGTRRIAYYTNIPPGNYRFRVVACNNDGVWSESGAAFSFRLLPHFYETYWFYGLYIFAAGLIVAAGYRVRTRQLRSRQQELVHLVEERTAALKAEKEKTESALIAAEAASRAAEEASRTKSQFLANMSHELRTPLNAIIGYSEILQEEAAESQQDLIPDILKIRGAGKHLLSLINDILDLSKIEAGKMDLRMESFDLRQFQREVVTTIEPMLTKNNNRLNVRSIGPSGHVFMDSVRLRQILLNLLSNATKFTENGMIYFDVERNGDLLFFRIQDTGIGIKPEQLERLFQPFEQADSSTSRKFGGTGLGLVISKRFCQMMGGDIIVESEYGKGSTFIVWIPAAPGESPAERIPV